MIVPHAVSEEKEVVQTKLATSFKITERQENKYLYNKATKQFVLQKKLLRNNGHNVNLKEKRNKPIKSLSVNLCYRMLNAL